MSRLLKPSRPHPGPHSQPVRMSCMALLCQRPRPRLGYSTNTQEQLTFDGLPPRRVVLELGGCGEPTRLLNRGHLGLPSREQLPGGELLGRMPQKLWPIESGAFRHLEWEQMNLHTQLVRDQTKRTRRKRALLVVRRKVGLFTTCWASLKSLLATPAACAYRFRDVHSCPQR